MTKPTVYLDTTIISAYWYDGADVVGLARRVKTRDWWADESPHFSLWVSNVDENELAAGEFRRQLECLRFVRRLRYLPITKESRDLAATLMESGVVPENKPADALQVALSTANDVDYLLSWNYAHLANLDVQKRLEAICGRLALRAPVLVSPETITRATLGQVIRRK
jgi:hypothetical protein